jgi:membrane protease YdiL (CAAX protease family)
LRWRVGGLWYLVLLALLLLRLLPVGAHALAGGSVDWAALGPQVLALPLIFVFIAVMGGGLDEEVGWRGYALPRLQAPAARRASEPRPGSSLVGLAPAPVPDAGLHARRAPRSCSTSSRRRRCPFVLGWIWNGTRGSLLLVVLAHAASNAGDNLRYVAVGFADGRPTWS